ncbi:GNAT family N-acetyltransferase [Halomarina oriensis]|uniref:GNAT family N-acetyltransferase n=1 Tax=Halomarina oriensis TaxID=671145 RepID=A0A6B0GGY9_9EURY|nr:GNAT family N-acetyltransferase [Halomarina oriensis]MWG33830.1 GNAT family N-acetyltransferase [Halomarina oriensis]
MDIRLLTDADVDGALRLSTQANWNQTATDWRRLIALAPDACYGGWVDGDLVATATVVSYAGAVGWVGMVLVDEAHRRRGYGSAMFERALDDALDDGLRVGLDATADGRTVYRQYGFENVAPIVRWSGAVEPTAETGDVEPVDDSDRIAAFDRRACGTDRRDLLARLLAEEGAVGLVRGQGSELNGYAVLRPGRERAQLGPLVATDRETCAALLSAAASRFGALIVDSLADGAMDGTFRGHGLRPERDLTRMVHGNPAEVLMGETVVAAAGFELG